MPTHSQKVVGHDINPLSNNCLQSTPLAWTIAIYLLRAEFNFRLRDENQASGLHNKPGSLLAPYASICFTKQIAL